MTDGLQISVHNGKEGAVMYLRGRLSIESSPDLREHLLAVLRRQSPTTTIAIDLAAVSYMDASGIATLIEGLNVRHASDHEVKAMRRDNHQPSVSKRRNSEAPCKAQRTWPKHRLWPPTNFGAALATPTSRFERLTT